MSAGLKEKQFSCTQKKGSVFNFSFGKVLAVFALHVGQRSVNQVISRSEASLTPTVKSQRPNPLSELFVVFGPT